VLIDLLVFREVQKRMSFFRFLE